MYKTISYPRHESGTGQIERLRISLNPDDDNFVKWLSALSSREIRSLLHRTYSQLRNESVTVQIPISQIATKLLKRAFENESMNMRLLTNNTNKQLGLFPEATSLGRHGTFSPNHLESIHRWYPYIEGFSATFVSELISKWGNGAHSVFDPFAGTGTTMTVGALMGLRSAYAEINPFMRLVIEGKTNVLRRVSNQRDALSSFFSDIIEYAQNNLVPYEEAKHELNNAFSGRLYFERQRLIEILSLRNAILHVGNNEDFRHLALLALGSIAVQCSELKRAADLRYRKPKELLPDNFSVFECYKNKIKVIIDDIDPSLSEMESVECICEDALADIPKDSSFDLIVTSPPYLNGTNYFRNTKIELWLTGCIDSEKDLGRFTRLAVTAGINNVSKNGRDRKSYNFVEIVAKELDEVAYDKRIPELVRRYCSDAEIWLGNCYRLLAKGGRAIIDIGDSKFAGVHVPTDIFLERIAQEVGLSLEHIELVRERASKDGTPLKQVLLVLKKPKYNGKAVPIKHKTPTSTKAKELRRIAKCFEDGLPHRNAPYSSRNWGHPLHSLCSYQGKLKPAIAHFLVTNFTKPGDVVLDPMSGAGTIPLEAFLTGRKAYANDLQELGFILSSSKVRKPKSQLVLRELENLLGFIEKNWNQEDSVKYGDFGFNGKLSEYFHERTFKEILAARRYMLENSCTSTERALVYSSLLHILHGNRPYSLSRRSHPVTPLKPQGEFEYRDIKTRLEDKVSRVLASYHNDKLLSGKASFGSFEDLNYRGTVDAVITSPPFAASTRFYIANWMRLWMSGWEPEDFSTRKERFVEHRQKSSFDIYSIFFKKCYQWLRPKGIVIMHLGKTKKHDMVEELITHCNPYFEVAYYFDECVVGSEKFGLKDQGATKAHQYLFLVRRD